MKMSRFARKIAGTRAAFAGAARVPIGPFVLAAVGLAGAAGCRSAVADFYADLANGGGSAGGAGGTGSIPMECQGDPTKDPGIVRDECGVFVDAGAPTTGDGTKASPFKTVSEAAKTGKSIIFICAATYAEPGTVELSNGVSVYGGFEACPSDGDWLWDNGKRAVIDGTAGAPVMKISLGQNHLEGVDLVAPDAVLPNTSSIALVVESAAVDLVNVHVTAGRGADGESGTTPAEAPAPGTAADSNSPTDACLVGTISGGKGAVTACGDGNSQGGDGGKGGTVPANNGEPGADGMPLPPDNPLGDGLGGPVDPVTGVCQDGKDGRDGVLGDSGAGGSGKGTLTANGVVGGDGGDGKAGSRGQGGGGGGGAKAGVFCGNPLKEGAGASGGGGGGGGCGGKGGTGGRAGGSSIGILALASSFTFSGVLVKVGDGGLGGDGGFGVPGALGGDGATGGAKSGGTSAAGCDGGDGGYGGNGGSGGGGRGGHSVGIAFKGDAPNVDAGITIEIGAEGQGGTGDPNVLNDGTAGSADDLLDFGTT
jgi:hypothetical protein